MRRQNKPVILLIAEAVTLAHFARIVTLAKALDPLLYEVVVASDPRYMDLEKPFGYTFQSIRSISSADFTQALAQGKPLYSAETLIRYVEDDLELLDRVKPDLIVGDFRLSLAVSAPLRKIPYAAVVNAYWSPFADIASYPIPDLPITQILGVRLTQKFFDFIRPVVFALHARPLNQVRKHFGLTSLGSDLRSVYSWGDFTLYADIPEIAPTHHLPANHHYLGPVLWSTQTPLPAWWHDLPEDKPVILVTLGSSGQSDLLPAVLDACSQLPVTVIAATAGKIALTNTSANAYIADYLPLDTAIQRARLLISNGGSLTTYQALVKGIPIIGLCSNMDQLLNMSAIERSGAGLMMRAAQISSENLRPAVNKVMNDTLHIRTAQWFSQIFRQYNIEKRFQAFVSTVLNS